MIVDLTMGFNELALFEIRYNELKQVVDGFVIIEANTSHAGNQKPYYFTEAGIGEWPNVVIIRLETDEKFAPLDPQYSWHRENYQREMLGLYVKQVLKPSDIIMLSDMDEIPRASALIRFLADNPYWSGIHAFEQDLSYLFFNTTAGKWNGTKLLHVNYIPSGNRPMTDSVRYSKYIKCTLPNGGWHFSSCGGMEQLRQKFTNYAHIECRQMLEDRTLENALENIVNPFDGNQLVVRPITMLPSYVQDNLGKYDRYIYWE